MLTGLESLSISRWIATADWGYPIFLSIHSMGMAIVVGILVMFDLRLLGLAPKLPIRMFEKLMPITWIGFLINLVSGTLLFMSSATRLIVNWPFISKLGAIAIGGFLTFYLWQSVRKDLMLQRPSAAAAGQGLAVDDLTFSGRTRLLAVLSLMVWFSAILFGRLIAYVLDAALLNGEF